MKTSIALQRSMANRKTYLQDMVGVEPTPFEPSFISTAFKMGIGKAELTTENLQARILERAGQGSAYYGAGTSYDFSNFDKAVEEHKQRAKEVRAEVEGHKEDYIKSTDAGAVKQFALELTSELIDPYNLAVNVASNVATVGMNNLGWFGSLVVNGLANVAESAVVSDLRGEEYTKGNVAVDVVMAGGLQALGTSVKFLTKKVKLPSLEDVVKRGETKTKAKPVKNVADPDVEIRTPKTMSKSIAESIPDDVRAKLDDPNFNKEIGKIKNEMNALDKTADNSEFYKNAFDLEKYRIFKRIINDKENQDILYEIYTLNGDKLSVETLMDYFSDEIIVEGKVPVKPSSKNKVALTDAEKQKVKDYYDLQNKRKKYKEAETTYKKVKKQFDEGYDNYKKGVPEGGQIMTPEEYLEALYKDKGKKFKNHYTVLKEFPELKKPDFSNKELTPEEMKKIIELSKKNNEIVDVKLSEINDAINAKSTKAKDVELKKLYGGKVKLDKAKVMEKIELFKNLGVDLVELQKYSKADLNAEFTKGTNYLLDYIQLKQKYGFLLNKEVIEALETARFNLELNDADFDINILLNEVVTMNGMKLKDIMALGMDLEDAVDLVNISKSDIVIDKKKLGEILEEVSKVKDAKERFRVKKLHEIGDDDIISATTTFETNYKATVEGMSNKVDLFKKEGFELNDIEVSNWLRTFFRNRLDAIKGKTTRRITSAMSYIDDNGNTVKFGQVMTNIMETIKDTDGFVVSEFKLNTGEVRKNTTKSIGRILGMEIEDIRAILSKSGVKGDDIDALIRFKTLYDIKFNKYAEIVVKGSDGVERNLNIKLAKNYAGLDRTRLLTKYLKPYMKTGKTTWGEMIWGGNKGLVKMYTKEMEYASRDFAKEYSRYFKEVTINGVKLSKTDVAQAFYKDLFATTGGVSFADSGALGRSSLNILAGFEGFVEKNMIGESELLELSGHFQKNGFNYVNDMIKKFDDIDTRLEVFGVSAKETAERFSNDVMAKIKTSKVKYSKGSVEAGLQNISNFANHVGGTYSEFENTADVIVDKMISFVSRKGLMFTGIQQIAEPAIAFIDIMQYNPDRMNLVKFSKEAITNLVELSKNISELDVEELGYISKMFAENLDEANKLFSSGENNLPKIADMLVKGVDATGEALSKATLLQPMENFVAKLKPVVVKLIANDIFTSDVDKVFSNNKLTTLLETLNMSKREFELISSAYKTNKVLDANGVPVVSKKTGKELLKFDQEMLHNMVRNNYEELKSINGNVEMARMIELMEFKFFGVTQGLENAFKTTTPDQLDRMLINSTSQTQFRLLMKIASHFKLSAFESIRRANSMYLMAHSKHGASGVANVKKAIDLNSVANNGYLAQGAIALTTLQLASVYTYGTAIKGKSVEEITEELFYNEDGEVTLGSLMAFAPKLLFQALNYKLPFGGSMAQKTVENLSRGEFMKAGKTFFIDTPINNQVEKLFD